MSLDWLGLPCISHTWCASMELTARFPWYKRLPAELTLGFKRHRLVSPPLKEQNAFHPHLGLADREDIQACG